MQHPDSQSTPKKVKPLKTKDEFSSLHKRIRPLKEPLPIPVAQNITRKPRIHGSERIISTIGNPSGKARRRPIDHTLSQSKSYECLINGEVGRIKLDLPANEIQVFPGISAEFSSVSLDYSISEDRKFYTYTLFKRGTARLKFNLSSKLHIPFKNDCNDVKLALKNVGPNIPPLSKRVEPLAPLARISVPNLTLAVKLIDCSPSLSANLVGQLVEMVLNERGVYFTKSLYKYFRWSDETVTKKNEDGHEKNSLVTISSSQMSISVDVLSEETSRRIDAEFERLKVISQQQIQQDTKISEKTKDEPQFGSLDPAKFYSPSTKSASGSGLKRPASSSSPRQLMVDHTAMTPNRSVESVRNLSRTSGSPLSTSSPASPRLRIRSPDTKPSDELKGATEILNLNDNEEAISPIAGTRGDLPTSPERPRRRKRKNRHSVEDDLVDGEREITAQDCDQLRSEGFKPVLYKFWDGRSMRVGMEDIARLNPQIYVNDTIIWFYLRMYMEKVTLSNPTAAEDIILLDTFFYYTMRNESSPPSWASRIPFNKREIVVMPIHESSHWNLAIIFGLNKRLSGGEDPIKIVILDSMGTSHTHHTTRKVVTVLTKSVRMQDYDPGLVNSYVGMRSDIPTQPNTTDCGVYLLHYASRIFANVELFREKLLEANGRTLEMGSEFWAADAVLTKRADLKEYLKSLGNVEESPEDIAQSNAPGGEIAGSGSTRSSEQGGSEQKGAHAENPDEDDDDAIEVIGMETVATQNRLNRIPSAFKSRNRPSYLGPPRGRPGLPSNTDQDVFKSP